MAEITGRLVGSAPTAESDARSAHALTVEKSNEGLRAFYYNNLEG